MRDAVIVSSVRTAVGKSGRGALATTRPDDLAATAITGALARVPQLDRSEIEDVILGCAMPEAEQGMNVARIAALRAGLARVELLRHDREPLSAHRVYSRLPMAADMHPRRRGRTSSLLEWNRIHEHGAHGRQQGERQSLAHGPLRRFVSLDGAHCRTRRPALQHRQGSRQTPLPWPAIKKLWLRSRQAASAHEIVSSNRYLCQHTQCGKNQAEHAKRLSATDEGPRADTSLPALAALKPAFHAQGNRSPRATPRKPQTVRPQLRWSCQPERAAALGITPLARLVAFATAGCLPEEMGIGPGSTPCA